MASLKRRTSGYILQFSKREGDKIIQRSFSLGTTDRRKADRLKVTYEDRYESGEIDPFDGWTPEADRTRQQTENQKSFMTLEEAADRFLIERTQANDVTKRGYRKVLVMMMDQLGRSMPISRLNSSDIRSICFRSDLATATQRSYFTHMKVFFKWLYEKNYITTNLVIGMKPPKHEDQVVNKIIDESDLRRLFNVFDEHIRSNFESGYIKHANQRMNWFKPMINTFFYAGLRSKELIHLKWRDIQEDFKYILIANSAEVTTKSGKSRKVPIRAPLAIVLRNWKLACNPEPGDYIFSNVNSKPGKAKMDSFRISHAFKRFARLANLPEHCNIHGLRHSFGTDLLRKGVPINRVSEMMGHSTIEVTKIYQHLSSEDLYDSVKGID